LADLSASPGVQDYLARAEAVIWPRQASLASPGPPISSADGELYAGVDLGTAYLVLVVLDAQRQPLAGEYQFAEVVRDGQVVYRNTPAFRPRPWSGLCL
jgi:ethanolamine utilization protein EutJ